MMSEVELAEIDLPHVIAATRADDAPADALVLDPASGFGLGESSSRARSVRSGAARPSSPISSSPNENPPQLTTASAVAMCTARLTLRRV